MCLKSKYRKGFTIIELLIVISIISILASMMMPALSSALERGRQASCRSNLRQFGILIQMFEDDTDRMPPYISALYPDYELPRALYLCPSDGYNGELGGKPYWGDDNNFPETNELPHDYDEDSPNPEHVLRNQAGDGAWEMEVYGVRSDGYTVPSGAYRIYSPGPGGENATEAEPWRLRNPAIEASSYMYEFSVAWVPEEWGEGDKSWHDYKKGQVREVGTHVPVLRCWWHTTPRFRPNDTVINLGYHFGVYDSGIVQPYEWDDYSP